MTLTPPRPMRVCPGDGCDQRRDCVRWLWRTWSEISETFPAAPWRTEPVIDATGRPVGTRRVCDYLITREQASG